MNAKGTDRDAPEYSVVNCLRVLVLHLTLIPAFLVGLSWQALVVFLLSYYLRCFAIGGVYHRYFSHQSYKTSRWFQFVLTALACTAGQRGPLSWATSHRLHHQHADKEGDPHSPHLGGFWHAQMGWYLEKDSVPTGDPEIERFKAYPEILWLNRNHNLMFLTFLGVLFGLGELSAYLYPDSSSSGLQFVLWGGFASTLLLVHATGLINSATHLFGTRDFDTPDGSRNLVWLFPLTMGENWHNSHHRYPWSANTGVKPRHPDWIFLILRGLEKAGLVYELRDAQSDPTRPGPVS